MGRVRVAIRVRWFRGVCGLGLEFGVGKNEDWPG